MAVATTISSTSSVVVKDSAGTTTLYSYSASEDTTLATGAQAYSVSLADSTTDDVVAVGKIATIAFFWMRSTKAVTVQVTDSAAGTELEVFANSWLRLQFDTPVTNIYVTNASGAVAELDIVIGK